MPNGTNHWVQFWDEQEAFVLGSFECSAETFVRRSAQIVGYMPEDRVLDYGCGPGSIAARIKDRVAEVYCADPSDRYVQHCQERFSNDKNVKVVKLSGLRYFDLEAFPKQHFSKIICHSVLQYYRSPAEISELLKAFRTICQSNAQIILADLLVDNGFTRDLKDTWSNMLDGFRYGFILQLIKAPLRAPFRSYLKHRDKRGLLVVSKSEWASLLSDLNMQGAFSDERLTINAGHATMLIHL